MYTTLNFISDQREREKRCSVPPHSASLPLAKRGENGFATVKRGENGFASACREIECKLRPVKLLERFSEAASLPLPGTRQREGGGFRVANEQFDRMPFMYIFWQNHACQVRNKVRNKLGYVL